MAPVVLSDIPEANACLSRRDIENICSFHRARYGFERKNAGRKRMTREKIKRSTRAMLHVLDFYRYVNITISVRIKLSNAIQTNVGRVDQDLSWFAQ
jgi:hypothetical protein